MPEVAERHQELLLQHLQIRSSRRIPDAPLTDLGRHQAAAAGAWLLQQQQQQEQQVQQQQQQPRQHPGAAANPRIAAIVASPMLRGVQTARELQQQLGVPVIIHPLLFEAGGLFQGERHPADFAAPDAADAAAAETAAAAAAMETKQQQLGLTWQQLQQVCPGALLAPGISWPPEAPAAATAAAATTQDPTVSSSSSSAASRCCCSGVSCSGSLAAAAWGPFGGGYSPEAFAAGGPWWEGPRETLFATLRRALEIAQWMDSLTAHSGCTDTPTATAAAETSGDSAAMDALKGDGALLVVGHGLLLDLLMRVFVAAPAAGICCCALLQQQLQQLQQNLQQSSNCRAEALFVPQQQAAYFLSGNCCLSCLELVVHPPLRDKQQQQQQQEEQFVSKGRCCCCSCNSCSSKGLQRTVALVYWGREIVPPSLVTGHALGREVVVSI